MSLVNKKLNEMARERRKRADKSHLRRVEERKKQVKQNFPSLRDIPYGPVCWPWHNWYWDMELADDHVMVFCLRCGQVKYNAQFYGMEVHDSFLGYIDLNDPRNKLTPYQGVG
jgi:hypothetical protein